jgi:hypothetical protein
VALSLDPLHREVEALEVAHAQEAVDTVPDRERERLNLEARAIRSEHMRSPKRSNGKTFIARA